MAECCKHQIHPRQQRAIRRSWDDRSRSRLRDEGRSRTAKHRYELSGTPYYFCSARCLESSRPIPTNI